MKSEKNILLSLCLIFLWLSSYCQKYYDNAGHFYAYQKGAVIFDSSGKKLGAIIGNNLKDASGKVIAVFVTQTTSYLYPPYPAHLVQEKDGYIYDNVHGGTPIGRVEGNDVYDVSGNLLGRTDNSIMESDAILFYFFLAPQITATKIKTK